MIKNNAPDIVFPERICAEKERFIQQRLRFIWSFGFISFVVWFIFDGVELVRSGELAPPKKGL